jgi:membrane protease YdiL (CAAX protease family)
MDRLVKKENFLLFATFPIIFIGLVNGLYMETLYNLEPFWFWVVDSLQFVFIPGFILLMLLRISGCSPSKYGFKKMETLDFFGTVIFTTMIFWFLYEPVVHVLARVFDIPYPEFTYQSVIPKDGVLRIIVVLYFSLTAAFVEEVVFRALPWAYFSRTGSSKAISMKYILLSSILFGLIHWENGYHEILATFLLGIVACTIYVKIENIWPLICAHFFTDLTTFW